MGKHVRPQPLPNGARRAAAGMLAAVVVGLVVGGLAPVAGAHDPIILTEQQTTPERGPLLMDGTVSFALYGTIEAPGQTRGFRVRFAAGDTFILSALVPDLPPEQDLARRDLPRVQVISPSGETTDLEPGEISTFAEPFSGTNYRRFLDWSAPAEAGDYGVLVRGSVPARFTVSVGVRETFGTEVRDVPNREAGVGGVMEWYRTPPPTAPATTTTTASATTTVPGASGASGASDGDATAAADPGDAGDRSDGGGSAGWIALAAVALLGGAGAAALVARRRRA